MKKYPNELQEWDFARLADLSEGKSGSDIKAVCREAGNEPRRKGFDAKFFRVEGEGAARRYLPLVDDPPCSACEPDIRTVGGKPVLPGARSGVDAPPCRECGAVRMTIDVSSPTRGPWRRPPADPHPRPALTPLLLLLLLSTTPPARAASAAPGHPLRLRARARHGHDGGLRAPHRQARRHQGRRRREACKALCRVDRAVRRRRTVRRGAGLSRRCLKGTT